MHLSVQQILAWLQPFEALIKPELLQLEAQGNDSLKSIIDAKVASPDLHDALVLLDAALDAFAKLEINKLP